jgi:hypothetical protein
MKCSSCLGDCANPNRVLNPVRVTRDCNAPPRGLLHGRYRNTPPTPSQEGRAERRGADRGNTGSHLIIFNFQFSILHSPVRVTRDCDGRLRLLSRPRLQPGDCNAAPFSRALAQRFSASPNIWAKAPVVCGDHRTRRLKPGAIQTTARHCERSEAIAQTTNTHGAPATALSLAVTTDKMNNE